MKFKKNNKIGYRFSATYQPRKRGRKPNRFAQLKADVEKFLGCEISEADVDVICAFAAFASPEMQKPYIMNEQGKVNEETPAAIINLIMAIQRQTEQGRTDTLMAIFDRLFGTPTQTMEASVTASNGGLDFSLLTDEELLEYNRLMEKARNGQRQLPSRAQ